jgi:hypothetical protein
MNVGWTRRLEVAMATRAAVLLFSLVLAVPLLGGEAGAAPGQAVRIEVVPDGQHQEVRLRDGSRLFGRVVRIEDDRIVFKTLAGADVNIPRDEIAHLDRVKGEPVQREGLPADPNTTRLLFAPTGRSVPQGQGYVGVYEFLMPFVQVGVTDRISIGGGTPLVFGGGSSHPVWLTPKVQFFSSGKLQMAAGAMHFVNVDDATFGIAYTVMTYGQLDSALTVGAGYAYAGDEDYSAGSAVVMVGGERRLSRRTKLVTENYWFEGSSGLASLGVRFIGDRLSADLGLAAPLAAEETIVFPVVNFVWTF